MEPMPGLSQKACSLVSNAPPFTHYSTGQRGFAHTLDIAGHPNATHAGAVESDASLRLINTGVVSSDGHSLE